MSSAVVAELVRRGVVVPRPDLVHCGPEVDPTRCEPGAVVHPFTRLEGRRTALGRGAHVGSGGPATVRDTVVGRGVDLASGTFEDSTFLDGAAFGPSGHSRAGTLFEEGARAAHACGVKQTILLPFATLGSLINFCDCLLAGGGAADDHSEVGSGFIHFNFSPSGAHGEKATPSLFGDATRGVFLREKRIFLGGDAGVVGPASIGFGTVLAAGTTYRKDRGAGLLVYAERLPDRERPFDPTVFRNAREKIAKNVAYLAQLAALRCFYREVRARLVAEDSFASLLVAAGVETIDSAAKERVKQLEKLAPDFACSAEALAASGDGDGGAEAAFQCAYAERFGAAKAALLDLGGAAAVDADGPHARDFAADVPARGVYLEWVRSLSAQAVERGVRRLTETAARYTAAAARALGL